MTMATTTTIKQKKQWQRRRRGRRRRQQKQREDQEKILEHFHAGKRKKAWLDAKTFAKHNVTIPETYAYLLGDASGCKST